MTTSTAPLDRWQPLVNPSNAWQGMLLGTLVVAALLTCVVGLVLLWRYRQRVKDWMALSSQAHVAAGLQAHALPAPAPDARTWVADPEHPHRRAAVVHALAGLTFGAVAAWVALKVAGIELTVNRFSVLAWVYAWPTLLTLGLIWTGQRSRIGVAWLVYAAGLSWLCLRVTQAGTPPMVVLGLTLPAFAQVLLIAGSAIEPAPLLLLVLNRKVRSIGPVVLPMMLMCCVAGMGAVVLTSMPALMEPLFHALYAISPGLTGLHMPLSFVLGAALASPVAWWWAKVMRWGHASGWVTDQSLVVDAIWLFQSLVLTLSISWKLGVAGLWGMSVFGVYKLVIWLGMRGAAQSARQHRPKRLLLLRVFNRRDAKGRLQSRQRDSERLFDALAARWRYAGPIYMISAPDLASSTVDPDEFLDFVSGNLKQRFIIEADDLRKRLASLTDRSDVDARWPVTEFFCGNEAWRPAVQALMVRSDIVVMDLRDFGVNNEGCLFELQALTDLVPAERIALVVGPNTQKDFLRQTLARCAANSPSTSPNAGQAHAMRWIDTTDSEAQAVQALMRVAQDMPAASGTLPVRQAA